MYVIIMDAEDAETYVQGQDDINRIVSAARNLRDADELEGDNFTTNNSQQVTVNFDGNSVSATIWKLTSDVNNYWGNINRWRD